MSDPSALPPLPKNHLDHPENWTTGSEPVTKNQAGFIEVLEKQKPDLVPEGGLDTGNMSKSDASDVIDKLKKGEKIDMAVNNPENHVETGGRKAAAEDKEEASTSSKRKEPAEDKTKVSAAKKDALDTKDSQAILDEAIEKSQSESQQQFDTGPALMEQMTEEKERPSKKARTDETTETKKDDKPNPKEAKDDKKESDETEDQGMVEDPIEVDTPPAEEVETPAEPETDKLPAKTAALPKNGAATNGQPKSGGEDTIPGDGHLDHPENWATADPAGDEPATEKQKGFIKVLEKQKGASGAGGDVYNLGKSEASEKIDELKHM